ncbi:MAG: hypothetical protein BGO89_13625 [Candidatus Kapaibacterium thiocyanatum]|uniref:Uncharacterized protein n=1 Tax=Candidatus Kapaibacterium thiocyanatum TaxID=1895771 RepID=A0A1M3KVF2_9BACT|nr:MAG: hypothetical protein BGO89_13625 ['Candidatus Kapabacteria' thiocyanatum]
MKNLQSLIESDLPVEKVVEVTLPLTRRAKPEYKGNAHVQLRVDFARGNGWSGIATVNGREIKITGPYGTQSKVPGLTVPAGTGRGEWEWSLDENNRERKGTHEVLQEEVGVLTLERMISVEMNALEKAMDGARTDKTVWQQLYAARQALAWVLESDSAMGPLLAILNGIASPETTNRRPSPRSSCS